LCEIKPSYQAGFSDTEERKATLKSLANSYSSGSDGEYFTLVLCTIAGLWVRELTVKRMIAFLSPTEYSSEYLIEDWPGEYEVFS
jgi:hypothetical protein